MNIYLAIGIGVALGASFCRSHTFPGSKVFRCLGSFCAIIWFWPAMLFVLYYFSKQEREKLLNAEKTKIS
jgi:hypothetical protein